MNKLYEILEKKELDKINPKIINHPFFTGQGTFIKEENSKNNRIFSILFYGTKDSVDFIFRLQLLELITQATENNDTIKNREKQVIKNLDKFLNINSLKHYEISRGFAEYSNLVSMSKNDKNRETLKNLSFEELYKISKIQLWNELEEETSEIITYFLNFEKDENKILETVVGIDDYLVKFSRDYVKSKIVKNIEGKENVEKPLEEDLTFIEDTLLLLDANDNVFSQESLIIDRFLTSKKDNRGFLQNNLYKENLDATVWGLRYSLSFLGCELFLETLKIMKNLKNEISVKNLIKYTKLYQETSIQPDVGIFIVN